MNLADLIHRSPSVMQAQLHEWIDQIGHLLNHSVHIVNSESAETASSVNRVTRPFFSNIAHTWNSLPGSSKLLIGAIVLSVLTIIALYKQRQHRTQQTSSSESVNTSVPVAHPTTIPVTPVRTVVTPPAAIPRETPVTSPIPVIPNTPEEAPVVATHTAPVIAEETVANSLVASQPEEADSTPVLESALEPIVDDYENTSYLPNYFMGTRERRQNTYRAAAAITTVATVILSAMLFWNRDSSTDTEPCDPSACPTSPVIPCNSTEIIAEQCGLQYCLDTFTENITAILPGS